MQKKDSMKSYEIQGGRPEVAVIVEKWQKF